MTKLSTKFDDKYAGDQQLYQELVRSKREKWAQVLAQAGKNESDLSKEEIIKLQLDSSLMISIERRKNKQDTKIYNNGEEAKIIFLANYREIEKLIGFHLNEIKKKWSYPEKYIGENKGVEENLASEAFLKAYEACQRFDLTRGFKLNTFLSKWIYGVFNKEMKKHQKKSLKEVLSIDNEDDTKSSPEEKTADLRQKSPEDSLSIKEQSKILTERMKIILSENEIAVLLLVEVKDHTAKEAARMMNIPEGTVKSHLFRGKNKLRADEVIRESAQVVLGINLNGVD